MKSTLFIPFILLIMMWQPLKAQVPDSLFFNLYTDSLKKGTFNYINVVGKYGKDRYLPLTDKELIFSADTGNFEGNSLFIDTSFTGEKVCIRAVLRKDTTRTKEIILYIKTMESMVPLKTEEEVLQSEPKRRNKRKSI